MRYAVTLKSCGNPDRRQNPYEDMSPARAHWANSIEECQEAVRAYIEEWNLGGGNWTGGNVYNDNGEYVGHISYNGRFWDKDHEYGKEVK